VQRIPGTFGSLDRMLDYADQFIAKRFKHVGRIYPMFHAETTDDVLLIDTILENKDAVAAMLTKFFAEKNVQRFVFIDEAWFLDIDQTGKKVSQDELDKIMREGIKDNPDRREVVQFHAQDAKMMHIWTREIIRPAKGKAKLGPLKKNEEWNNSQGRWHGLLSHLRTGALQ
jgi:hypothetical protein